MNKQPIYKLTYYPDSTFGDQLEHCCPIKFKKVCLGTARLLARHLKLPVTIEIYGRRGVSNSTDKFSWNFEGSVLIASKEVAQLIYSYNKFDRQWRWSLDAESGRLRLDGHREITSQEAVKTIKMWIAQDYQSVLAGPYLLLEECGIKVERWTPPSRD